MRTSPETPRPRGFALLIVPRRMVLLALIGTRTAASASQAL